MRFAHFSDTHLGFRQYGIFEREMDFYRAFEKTVSAILKERPDFVLHTGDLFDVPKPPPRALWVAQRCFSKLREKGIPVYAITGNHDMLMRRGAMPPQVLYRDFNVRLLTEEDPFVVHDGVFIAGVPYMSRSHSASLSEAMRIASEKAAGHPKSVLMLHQGTDRHLRQAYEIEMKDIPGTFSYYAMGHVHARIVHDFGKGKFAYPGSTELWSANEYADYKKNGKGFYMVDLGGDVPDVQPVTVELEREIMRERLGASGIREKVDAMKASLSRLPVKPMLYLDVVDSGLERSSLRELLDSKLSGHLVSLRLSYVQGPGEDGKLQGLRPFDLPQVHEIIGEIVKDKGKAGLASALLRSLSEGDTERAQKEAEEYFSSGA